MIHRASVILFVSCLAISAAQIGVNCHPIFAQTLRQYNGLMIDAHANAVNWSPDWMVRTLEAYHEAGIDKVVFSDGDGALQAHNLRPNEIIPSFYIYYMNRTSTVTELKAALDDGFMWIGEALLRHWGETNTPADDPVALQIFDLCAKYHVPITVHQDSSSMGPAAYTELERALNHSPDCIVAFHGWWWNDLGMNELERMILVHPNLYIELAGQLEESIPPWTSQSFLGGTQKDIFTCSNGQIREEWRYIFEKYPSRFINGFHLFSPGAYTVESIRTRVQYWRNLLAQLNQETAERIAYKNVEDLLQHRTPSELGTLTVTNTTHSSAVINGYGGGANLLFKIDGSATHWASFQPIIVSSLTTGRPGSGIKAVYGIVAGKYLYVMIQTYEPPDPSNSYIFPLDLTGNGHYDYSFGFNIDHAWMYNLTGVPAGQWPDSRLSTPDAIYAIGNVAEIAIPLALIGNPTRINLTAWINIPLNGQMKTVSWTSWGSVTYLQTTTTTSTATNTVNHLTTSNSLQSSSEMQKVPVSSPNSTLYAATGLIALGIVFGFLLLRTRLRRNAAR